MTTPCAPSVSPRRMRQNGRNIAVSMRFGLRRPNKVGFGLASSRATANDYFFFAALVALPLLAASALGGGGVGGPGWTESPNSLQLPSTA